MSDAIVIQPEKEKKDVKQKVVSKWNIFHKNTAPSTAVTRPMSNMNKNATKIGEENKKPAKRSKNDKNEIFVDIFEKLSVLFNANGAVINSSIDGVI